MAAINNSEFLLTVFGNAPEGAVPWVAGFKEDPLKVDGRRWGGLPVVNCTLPWFVESDTNNFVAISTFRKGADGKYHRRKENFAACHLIMVDDVGTKIQPWQIPLEPSYKLETSPGNYQYGYLLASPGLDGDLIARVIDAMIAQGLATDGKDPGMKGVTRYGRLPVGWNTKSKYVERLGAPFVHQLEEWHPDQRFTLQKIIEAFELDLGRVKGKASAQTDDPILKALESRGLLKGPISGKAGVWDVSCPWLDEHTDRADSGAAYFQAHFDGRDTPGYRCHHGHCEGRTIKDLLRFLKPEKRAADAEAKQEASTWPDPEQLPGGLQPVPKFDYELLPEILRPWVKDIVERAQLPPDFPAVGAIVAAGSLIGRKVGIRPKRYDDWLEIPNLWGAVIGRPEVMKSPALEEALKPLKRLAHEAAKQYENELEEHKVSSLASKLKVEAAKATALKILKENPVADVKNILREDADPPPVCRRFIVTDTTVEALAEVLRQNPNGILAYRDELIGLLRQLDKAGNEGARDFFLTGWNGKTSWASDRIIRGLNLRVEACCISVLGGIQPGVLSSYLMQAVRGAEGDDGLFQRFSMLVWPDVDSDWENVDQWPSVTAKTQASSAFDRLKDLTAQALGATQDADGGIPYLRFNPEAQTEFDEWRKAFEKRIRSGEQHPAFEAHLAKYRKLVPSLALTFHVLDSGVGPVLEEPLLRALSWAEYLEAHAVRVYGSLVCPEIVSAKHLLKHILANDLGSPFTLRDIYRKGWAGLSVREDVEKALEVLASYGWVRIENVRVGDRGPLTQQISINPKSKKTCQ